MSSDIFCLRTFHLDEQINCCAILPNDSSFVVGCRDNAARLCDLHTGEVIRVFRDVRHHAGFIRSVAISKDGKYLATSAHKIIKLWDIETGTRIRTFVGHDDMVTSVAISSDCHRVVSGSTDGYIKVWNIQTGRMMNSFQAHTRVLDLMDRNPDRMSLRLSSDGRTVVTSSAKDTIIKLFGIEDGELKQVFGRDFVSSSGVSLSKDDSFIMTGGYNDTSAKMLQVQTGMDIRSFGGRNRYHFLDWSDESIILSSDDHFLVTIGYDSRDSDMLRRRRKISLRSFKLWNVQTGEEIRTYRAYDEKDENHTFIQTMSFTTDGKCILSGNQHGIIKLWGTSHYVCFNYRLDHFYGRQHLFLNDNQVRCPRSQSGDTVPATEAPEAIWSYVFSKLHDKPDFLYYYIKEKADLFLGASKLSPSLPANMEV